MAIIGYDGFDHYAGGADMEARSGTLQWSGASGVGAGRGGYGQCALVGTLRGGLSNPINQMTLGFAVNFAAAPGGAIPISIVDNLTGTTQCSWNLNSDSGLITFTDANGNNIATALNSLVSNGWQYVELQNRIGIATGSGSGTAAIRINGQPVASFPDLTGVLTQKSTNNSMSGIIMSGNTGSFSNYSVDDLYICDGTTGPGTYPCNSFLGDIRDSTQFAVGNGGTIDWTPLANMNWQEISEVQMDGDTSYNRSNAVGAIDLFNPQVLNVDIDQVICLAVTIAVRLEDAGARLIAPCIQIGSTVYVGTPQAVDLSYIYLTSYWPINPATGVSWTTTDVNDCRFGYKIVA